MIVMGIETSCDETAAAIVKDTDKIFSNVILTQIPYHRRFGGVVPEIASRRHLEAINSVIDEAVFKSGFEMSHIDRFAVTVGPGLVGSLIVGIVAARTLGKIYKKPVFGVNHILSHLAVNFLFDEISPPYLGLVASGGHCDLIHAKTHNDFEVLSKTRDDAPGETFDKIAKMLGLPYPGGAEIEKIAKRGNPDSVKFPVPKFKDGSDDFSFSGIKTFVKNRIGETPKDKIPDLLASFQKAVAKIFADRIMNAVKKTNCIRVILAGGVISNNFIVSFLSEECAKNSVQLFWPRPEFCTDNAAMTACRGFLQESSLKLIPQPDLKI
ncbi:MAG: tRNA (adenosine(37)-N6)-threonylcarbamoyltransferase complex transferase subunit TsaD [Elusimicrobia bacterium CG08_land_8_20_14_0_20_44_26]|nr:MAG: tRNA (adenosine(37)-N6)-threonylcarbamoyltransferase complex transferase subunit TsaD [Elusimicrobia bacterium CG08_land_8_20_14_0_20_44_26]